MAIDDGGAAYPSLQRVCLPGTDRAELALVGGMSLHDHYVGQLLANPNIVVANFHKASRGIAQAVEIIADACIEAKRRREAEEAKDNG